MSINYGSKHRRDFIKSIDKVSRSLESAYTLFSVLDDLLIEDGDKPILLQNKERVNAGFAEIQKHLQEIVIILAEDKHRRIRR